MHSGKNCSLFAIVRTMDLHQESFSKTWKKATLNMHQSGMTLKPLEQSKLIRLVETFSASQQASHAKTCHVPKQTEKDCKVKGQDCSLKSSESFAWFDQESSSWKTSQLSLFQEEGWTPFCQNFAKQGMMQDGLLWEQTMLVPYTEGRDCGFWRTPCASDGEGGVMQMNRETSGHYKLRDQVQEINKEFWPTPTASNKGPVLTGVADNGKTRKDKHGRSHGATLDTAVTAKMMNKLSPAKSVNLPLFPEEETIHAELLPTPTSGSGHAGGTMGEWGGSGNWVREELQGLATGHLNPQWVAWLMGYPIEWTD